MSGSPATSDVIPLILAASLLIALSNASGPSSRPPVICPRSAILQSAAASIVAGIFELTVSTAARIATFGVSTPSDIARSIAFWQMSTLSSSVGAMLMAASVTIEHLVIGRHVHDEDVADAAARAQARLARDDRAQQLVGVQAALHQELRLAPGGPAPRLCSADAWLCGASTIRVVAEVDAVLLGDLVDLRRRADEDRRDELLVAGLDRAGERRRLARVRHGGRDRVQAATAFEQLFVFAGSSLSIHVR